VSTRRASTTVFPGLTPQRGQSTARFPVQKLAVDPDTWQGRSFDARGNIKVAQLRFWPSAQPQG